jgi:hypothetical protein
MTMAEFFQRYGRLFVIGSVVCAALAPLQGQRAQGQNPACALLTTAEVRTVTGFAGYGNPSPGDPPGQGAGGGASCQYEATSGKGPLLSIVLIEGKNYTQTVPIGRGCNKETAAGVGDQAFFEVCPAARRFRTPPLYVKAGTRDLIVQMDIKTPDTDTTIRPKVIAVAKAAVAKLK